MTYPKRVTVPVGMVVLGIGAWVGTAGNGAVK